MKTMYPGMKARLIDGGITSVTDILISREDHSARFVVLSPHGYFGPDVLAPVSAVWRVDEAVHLTLTADDLEALPRYDHYAHCRPAGLYSRSAWRYGAARPRSGAPIRR